MSEQRKAVIKNADMDDKMQQDAVDIASKALSEYNIEKVCHFGSNDVLLKGNVKLSVRDDFFWDSHCTASLLWLRRL